MSTNSPSTALEALQSAYRVAPESKIFAPLGDAYRHAGRLAEAVQVLEQGTARHPDYVSALVLLALCQMDLGHDDEAEATLARVLALDPENLVALKGRARRALGRGDWAQVEPLVELVLGIDPYDREAVQLRDEARTRRVTPAVSGPPPPPLVPPAPSAPPAWRAADMPIPAPPPVEPRPQPPVVPAGPSLSDAEWDVQRDADRIVIRPRPLPATTPLPTPGDEFSTPTLARIYESQGLVDKAIAIYEELQRQQPGNPDIAARLQALRQRLAASLPEASPPTAPGPASDTAAPRWRLLHAEDAEGAVKAPEQAAEQLRELADTVRERERSRHHTQIGTPTTAAPPPTAAEVATTAADEPDFERFLRYVRSLKHTR